MLGGMVANFTADPTKDQLTICRALPAVIKQFPNFHFVFAGRVADGAEGRMADCLNICIENGIADHVHFLGGRSDVPDILSELDVFVFSSRQEGFPVAVSEAILAGVPLIVSDIEPLLEATHNGEFGETFPVGDNAVLSAKLTSLLADPDKRHDLTTRAKAFALDNFSIDSHMRGLIRLYGSLI